MTTLDPAGVHQKNFTRFLQKLAARREYGLAMLLALIAITATLRSPEFLAPQNLKDIFANASQTAVIACGVMLVVITGEIDISVGSALGFLSAILGTLVAPTTAPVPGLGLPVALAVVVVLLAGTAIGLINGVLVTRARVPSIIVTLAMLMILKSATTLIMHRGFLSNLPDSLSFFGTGKVLGMIMPLWIMAAVLLATFALLRFTPLGRRIYAVGSNPDAARLAGISVAGVKIFTFAITGFLVGIATLITQLTTFDNAIGAGLELLVITCVVVGGVSISGGTGTLMGVFLAVLLLSIQKTFLIFLKLGPGWAYWDKAIQGALILTAVLLDHLATRRQGDTRGGH